MTHDAELRAAAYLAGELSDKDRQSFEDHLLECDDCWAEVDKGRRGMRAVESVRELAPAHLRERIRGAGANIPVRADRRPRRVIVIAAALALVAGAAAGSIVWLRPSGTTPISAAVAGYSDDRLPGSLTPRSAAPDLSALRMTGVGAGAGLLEGMQVTAYAYRDSEGRRLTIYISTTPFPMPEEARMFHGSQGPWMAHRDGITVLASRAPHELLIVGDDQKLVHDAAVALNVM